MMLYNMLFVMWYTFKTHSIAILNHVKGKIEVFSVHKESFLIILLLPRIFSNSANIFYVTLYKSFSFRSFFLRYFNIGIKHRKDLSFVRDEIFIKLVIKLY